jgi:hypothetical protein
VRGPTRPADRAPEAALLAPGQQAHLAIDSVPPGPQAHLATRAAQAATLEFRLDSGLVCPYDKHSGAPASLGRAPSRSVERSWARGLLRVQIVLTLTPPTLPVKPRPSPGPCSPIAAPPKWSPNRAHAPRRQTAQSWSTSSALNKRCSITGKAMVPAGRGTGTLARYSLCRATWRAVQWPTTGAHSETANPCQVIQVAACRGNGYPHQPGHQSEFPARYQSQHPACARAGGPPAAGGPEPALAEVLERVAPPR